MALLVATGASVGWGTWTVELLFFLCLPILLVAWPAYLLLSVLFFDVSRDDMVVRLWFLAFWLSVAYVQCVLLAVGLRHRRLTADPFQMGRTLGDRPRRRGMR